MGYAQEDRRMPRRIAKRPPAARSRGHRPLMAAALLPSAISVRLYAKPPYCGGHMKAR